MTLLRSVATAVVDALFPPSPASGTEISAVWASIVWTVIGLYA